MRKKPIRDRLRSLLFFVVAAGLLFLYIWLHPGLRVPFLHSGHAPSEETQVTTPLTQVFSNLLDKKPSSPPKPSSAETTVTEGDFNPTSSETEEHGIVVSAEETETGQSPVTLPENSTFRVDFVDVGQADFMLVECDGHYMTIDGGNVADSQLVYSFLESRGVEAIDYVVVTHAHEDHCGGVSAILSKCTAKTVFSPVTDHDSKAFANVVKKARAQGLELTVPSAGDSFMLGSAACEIAGPISLDTDNINNTSIVIRVQYGNTSFLFTGDAEREEEADILATGYNVRADVLKVGHHGSSTSTSYPWLRQVHPAYAVISSNNKEVPAYGHPHEATLSKLHDAEVEVFRTDELGTITAISDGENIVFSFENQ